MEVGDIKRYRGNQSVFTSELSESFKRKERFCCRLHFAYLILRQTGPLFIAQIAMTWLCFVDIVQTTCHFSPLLIFSFSLVGSAESGATYILKHNTHQCLCNRHVTHADNTTEHSSYWTLIQRGTIHKGQHVFFSQCLFHQPAADLCLFW